MKLSSLPLPVDMIRHYNDQGIWDLYPPQAEVIDKGLLDGKNFLVSISTASGKTLMAELAMLKNLQRSANRVLYIVPLVALATEKYEQFKRLEKFDIRVGLSTSELDSTSEELGQNDIIVLTSEKADSLMRNGAKWIKKISCVVIDEIHLLNDRQRGPTLDVTITKLVKLNPEAQIIGLSATIGNAEEVAKWLNSELVVSDWRPTQLRQAVYVDGQIHYDDETVRVPRLTKDPGINLTIDTIEQGGQCLVFNSSRRNCSAFARNVSNYIKLHLTGSEKHNLAMLSEAVFDVGDSEESKKLAGCIARGAAFHHAGLNAIQRRIVENGFKDGLIKTISCTPTLSAGINLPARRVIVRQYTRYDSNEGSVPIPAMEYKQMAGRAGRPHLDPYGEAIIMSGTNNDTTDLISRYILSDAESIFSKLGVESTLLTHVLSCISSRYVWSKSGAVDFFQGTFAAVHMDRSYFEDLVNRSVDFLLENQFIIQTSSDSLAATALGKLVSRLYVDPVSAVDAINGLSDCDDGVHDIALMQIAAHTPNVRTLYLSSHDDFEPFYRDNRDLFQVDFDNFTDTTKEDFLSELKSAFVANDWINGLAMGTITRKFGIYEGDVHNLVTGMEWVVHAMSRIAKLLDLPGVTKLDILETRLKHGIPEELVHLVVIKHVGRARARKLFNAGYLTPLDVKKIDRDYLETLVGEKIAYKILLGLGVIKEEVIHEPLREQSSILAFGVGA
ncbi:DEAD/DEAH box helicase [Methanococcoides sp. SA1]|nr:DEAD/DEAH box helicase [Methanococcoides sp. SA1]